MPRVLLFATTTGYQTRAFEEAAARLGVELVYATDRCHVLDDPWQDHAIPVRFHDEAASVAAVVDAARKRPVDGLLVVGDRPTLIAAEAARALGLPGHPRDAVDAARSKLATRRRLRDRGLPVPWFELMTFDGDAAGVARRVHYPCVIKPLALSGSRGVMRADGVDALAAAAARLRALLASPDVRAERSELHDAAVIEGFIPGREYAVEGLLTRGSLKILAVFDKPDPLDGPFFEETIYVTPSRAPAAGVRAIGTAVAAAAEALGLHHGPIHAECRVNDRGVFVLEVAARPIGGLCARALRFTRAPNAASRIPLEELLLRHALGERVDDCEREPAASGVMMIPIPRRGIFRQVDGVEAARAVAGIDDVRITAKRDQALVPLPEGASYLGFIFASGTRPEAVEGALRASHGHLRFAIDPEIPVVRPAVQS